MAAADANQIRPSACRTDSGVSGSAVSGAAPSGRSASLTAFITAPGAVVNAINDALRPLGAHTITSIPVTPDIVLTALGKL